ncbi:hypothetical protein [Blastopirellula marina]|uniref:Parallel beta-helix repeat protein n=1 Tax=Blastopirellula marina DSM 3645 TaxID=314230 RepID=A3ZPI0_9BACT|nr:hypothetical protein [Blastopirellula marina]EAQ81658.1 Parallel beta-helix repeat protein [Blastopirellula marina DSM 3645]
MALYVWRGDARGRAQVAAVTAEFVEAGDVFTLTINRKTVSFTALGDSAPALYAGLADAIDKSEIPELADITAEVIAGTDAAPAYLKLTGGEDGRPFTITTNADNGSIGDVAVSTTVQASGGANEKQQVALPIGVTGGTFTLTFSGQTTSAVAYNASAATLQTALEALSNIDSGDVEVSGDAAGPWTIEFKQAYALTDVPAITMDSSSLTAGSVSVSEAVKGSGGANEIQRLSFYHDKNGTAPPGFVNEFQVYFEGPTTAAFAFTGRDFSEINTAYKLGNLLALHADITGSNISITTVTSTPNLVVYDVEFIGSLGSQNFPLMVCYDTNYYGTAGTGPADHVQNGDASGNNEQQVVTLLGSPSGGTFTLTFNGQTTSGIAYNASAATVQSALEALSNIASGDVAVTGDDGGAWTVEFDQAYANQDVPIMSASGASLTGGTGTISVTQAAAGTVNERQQVSLSSGVTGGTFTLTYAGQTTSALSYVAGAAAIESALEALSNIDAVSVTGPSGGPWAVEFQGSLAATNVVLMTGDGDNLTGDDSQTLSITTLVAPTGPSHWSEPQNWDQQQVPGDGDEVRLEDSETPILYGLNQADVVLASLEVRASYRGAIGLPTQNAAGYYEYLPTHLAIGATLVRIGEGEGSSVGRCRFDVGAAKSEITIFKTDVPSSDNGYAVEWIGTHAENVMTIYKGAVGVATQAGQTAALDQLNICFVSSRQTDALVYLGDGVTVGDIVKTGGELIVSGRSGVAIHSIQATAGRVEMHGADGVESLSVEGGEFYYWTTGALGGSAVISGDGQLIFDGDLRAKTVTGALQVYGDSASVIDTAEVVNAAGLLSIHFQGTSRFADLGNDIIISRGLPAESEQEVSISVYAAAMKMISIAVDDELATIDAMLTTAEYAHPSGKTVADIIQIDVISPSADVAVHDADNDTDGQTIAADGVEYFPIVGAAATALRMVTDSSASALLKIYYS